MNNKLNRDPKRTGATTFQLWEERNRLIERAAVADAEDEIWLLARVAEIETVLRSRGITIGGIR